MRNYLIEGVSGSGKSHLGDELGRRGYKVIEADWEPGLSSWVDKHSGQNVKHEPPFSAEWLSHHAWIWNEAKLNELLKESPEDQVQFLVGGADNMDGFMHHFTKRFFLYVSIELMKRRLQQREPHRWPDGSAELQRTTEWNRSLLTNPPKDVTKLDGSRPVAELADEVLEKIND